MSKPNDYNKPWMNRSLMRLWRRKHFAWKRYTERKSGPRILAYKRSANILKSTTRKIKRKYERILAKEVRQNKRAFFRYVRSKLTVRPEITEMQNENGILVDKVEDLCDTVGGYFNTVYIPRCNDTMPDMSAMYETEIGNIVVTREDVKSILEKLKVNKSCGPDNIHPYFLQATASAISVPLELIYNKSLISGECPAD